MFERNILGHMGSHLELLLNGPILEVDGAAEWSIGAAFLGPVKDEDVVQDHVTWADLHRHCTRGPKAFSDKVINHLSGQLIRPGLRPRNGPETGRVSLSGRVEVEPNVNGGNPVDRGGRGVTMPLNRHTLARDRERSEEKVSEPEKCLENK